MYEIATSTHVVTLVFFSLLLTLISFSQPISRAAVFLLCFVATSIFTVLVLFLPAVKYRRFNALLQACQDVSRDQGLRWHDSEMTPYSLRKEFPLIFMGIGITVALLGMWWYMFGRRHRARSRGLRRLDQPQASTNRKERVFLLLLSILTTIVTWRAWHSFRFILLRRHMMNLVWEGATGEDVWGIGQIGAPFAWLPLLSEMIHCALKVAMEKRERKEKQVQESREVDMEDMAGNANPSTRVGGDDHHDGRR
jgi:hypothetical protein